MNIINVVCGYAGYTTFSLHQHNLDSEKHFQVWQVCMVK